MPNLLVFGETNNGKSMIATRFGQMHPPSDNAERDHIIFPVLIVQAPPVPDENRFYNAVLETLNAPYRPSDVLAKKQFQVLRLLRQVRLEILIVDEIHHLLAGHTAKQRQFLNVLKYLGNELQAPIVGIGTRDAIRAVQSDPQLANRFEPSGLPRWEMNEDFLMLLASFERMLPLRRASGLTDQRLAKSLLALSEGTIGELAALLNIAAIAAVRNGAERIDEPLLKGLPWIPPSARKRAAERFA
jgi:hypothetical protein